VGLIVKTDIRNASHIDFEHAREKLSAVVNKEFGEGYKCKLYLLHGDLTEEQLSYLYQISLVESLYIFYS
jgi:hypothetical protein